MITVSHFGGIQAFPLARALHRARLLQLFYTGLHFRPTGGDRFIRPFAPKTEDYVLNLPAEKVMIPSPAFLLHKVANLVLPSSMRYSAMRHYIESFDLAVARDIQRRQGSRLFVGFELSSTESFRAANELGQACILEASSIHFSWQLPLVRGTSLFDHVAKTVERKVREIDRAKRIVVLSEIARKSYLSGGVDAEKLIVIPPCVEPISTESKSSSGANNQKVNYLFVGNLGFHKGVDMLLGAFDRLAISGKRLRIVGGDRTDSEARGVEWVARIPKSQLKGHFDWADFLVLPSRFDGFGLVVGEAMLHGLPVIVSDSVGAVDFVRHGENGWIFPSGDVEALTQTLREAASCGNWDAMSSAARRDAEPLRFDAYADRVMRFYRSMDTADREG